MAFAGLFLIVFLLVHLGINLCLLKQDGGRWFSDASHFMGTNYVVKIFELVLMAGFLIHIFIGVVLQIQNWMSRPVRYKVLNRTKTPFLSKYMIYTGIIIFIFLVIHFMNFYFIKLGWAENPLPALESGEPDFYNIAAGLFSNPVYSVIYIVLIAVLGFHLNHAFQSAFQTFGLNHSKYMPFIKACGTVYSIVVALGFIVIPVYFLLK